MNGGISVVLNRARSDVTNWSLLTKKLSVVFYVVHIKEEAT